VASDAFTLSRSIFWRGGIRGFYREVSLPSARILRMARFCVCSPTLDADHVSARYFERYGQAATKPR
jgi:hypothetical protein